MLPLSVLCSHIPEPLRFAVRLDVTQVIFHGYKDLWISVKPMIEHYAKEMGYDLNIVQLADTYLFDLSKLDKEGDKFRYPTDYGLVYSLQLTQVDYYQAVYWLIGIFNFVLGCSDMLDVAILIN